jgi:type I restriction enzyme S subunit
MNCNFTDIILSEAVVLNPIIKLDANKPYFYIEMKDLIPGNRYVRPSRTRNLTGGTRFAEGDILLARITPCLENGKTSQVIGLRHQFGFGSTEFIVIRGRNSISDTRFIYYLCRLQEFRKYAEKSMVGSSGRQRVDLNILGKFIVKLPPLPIQQRIAEILGALDDKIECNRRINETLEKMAIALYKHWFVNNPEDYESCPLTDFIDINPTIHIPKDKEIPYVDMKSLPINSMSVIDTDIIKRVFTSGSKFKNGDTLLARITPCLENGKTAFVDFLENNEAGYGSTEFIVMRAKNNVSPQFVYCCARDEDFRIHAISSMTGTSGRQRVEHSCFSRFSVNRFSNQVMQDFHIKTDVWFKQIRANVKEIFILSRTRDYLLPKLLSGEIEVKEAEKQVSNMV